MPVELFELSDIRFKGEWKPRIMLIVCMIACGYNNVRIIGYEGSFNTSIALYGLISNIVLIGFIFYFLKKIGIFYLMKASAIFNGQFDGYFDIDNDQELCELLILYQAALIVIENISVLQEHSFYKLFKEVHKLRRQEIKDLNSVVNEEMKYYDYKKNFLIRKSYIRKIYEEEDSVINGIIKANRSLIL